MEAQILIEIDRGPLIEAVHRGHIVVVDTSGTLVAWGGNPDFPTYFRSSAKPLQLLPLLEDQLDERFGFQEDELAVMAASHSGEERHVQAVQRVLARIGLDESALRCGVHAPLDPQSRNQLRLLNVEPCALHNNCSGKHAAMLALAVAGGHNLEEYMYPTHPVQKRLVRVIRDMTGEKPMIGVDGCGVPVFGLRLRGIAYAYACLGDPRELPPKRAEACRRVTAAMHAHPGMVSGQGRLGEVLSPATGGRLLGKSGAEGLYAVSIPPEDSPTGRGLGLVLKMEDGEGGNRARPKALLEALSQLGALYPEERSKLVRFDSISTYNIVGHIVGWSRPVFSLQWSIPFPPKWMPNPD